MVTKATRVGGRLKFRVAVLALVMATPCAAQTFSRPRGACEKRKVFTAENVEAWSSKSGAKGFFYKSGMAIDADGALRAYHPDDRRGLDSLAHAGHDGKWWALVTDNGKPGGRPVVQRKSDPAPGYYVSTTALYDSGNPNPRDPHRYVDAAKIPYVVLHPKALKYARLGDFATVINLHNGRISSAVVADESAPNLPVGEGSIALAKALGINANPRDGGRDGDIVYLIYPGTGNGEPRSAREIASKSRELFKAWGGLDKLRACLADD
jgi:hypothetical protein